MKRRTFVIGGMFVAFIVVAGWLLMGGWDNLAAKFVRTVYVEENYGERNIEENEEINLVVSGEGNIVNIRAGTEVRQIRINGNGNSIRLCEGIHNPKIKNAGIENEAVFDYC